jgi:hypothetical protein
MCVFDIFYSAMISIIYQLSVRHPILWEPEESDDSHHLLLMILITPSRRPDSLKGITNDPRRRLSMSIRTMPEPFKAPFHEFVAMDIRLQAEKKIDQTAKSTNPSHGPSVAFYI